MSEYTVYKHNALGYKAVKVGWDWFGFLLAPIWALVNKLWGILGITIFLPFIAALIFGPFSLLITLLVGLGCGTSGSDMLSKSLENQGYQKIDSFEANSKEDAISKIISHEKQNEKLIEESQTRDCPFCAETIKRAAKICRYCSKELPELELLPRQEHAQQEAIDPLEQIAKQLKIKGYILEDESTGWKIWEPSGNVTQLKSKDELIDYASRKDVTLARAE